MKTILLVHGPNLNALGRRESVHYGTITLKDIETAVQSKANDHGYDLICFQSNQEGALIDFMQTQSSNACAMLFNPGAFTHYCYALHDAILDTRLPTVEVHLSNLLEREPWRAQSVIAPACVHRIMGKKLQGYLEAIDYMVDYLNAD